METFSALLAICAGNSRVPGEFPAQRPVTRSFDVFFDLHPNKRLSKQWWGWWFETLSCPLWRHRNVIFQKSVPLIHGNKIWSSICLQIPLYLIVKGHQQARYWLQNITRFLLIYLAIGDSKDLFDKLDGIIKMAEEISANLPWINFQWEHNLG